MPDNIEPAFGGSPAPSSTEDNGGSASNVPDNSYQQGGQSPDSGFGGGSGDNLNQNANPFLASLSEENRRVVEAKGWKSPDDVIAGYRGAEAQMHKGLNIDPAGENGEYTPEQWDQFGKKVGAPEKAEFYQFNRPDVPEYVSYDENLESGFRETVHKYKLTKAQAAGVYGDMTKMMVDQQMGGHKQVETAISATRDALVREYGEPGSATYKDTMETAYRDIKATPGLLETYQRYGLLVKGQNGGYHPTDISIVRAHANAGNALRTESKGLSDMTGEPGGKNPFKPGEENLSAQGQIVRTNPDLARALIRQSGGNPGEYGL